MIPNISLWEHSARMKLKEISACEKKTRDESCDLAFFKTQNWFWMFFPGVGDRSKFSSAVVIHIPLWRNRFLSCAACPCGCTLCSGESS